jgi:SagB-type dehydrogenase family enzyme
MTEDVLPTAEFASLVYGGAGVPLDDPAEAFHEASRLYPEVAPGRLEGVAELSRNPALQQTVARASRTHDHRPGVELPAAGLGRARLRDVLRTRRSRAGLEAHALPCATIAALLGSSFRSTDSRRPIPSGGALYPLELYVVALAVDGLGEGVYHYSPFRHRLARLRAVTRSDVAVTLVDPRLADGTAALLVVTAVFWRTRFKYGLRGYRFALLEAGHLVQNAVLAAAALDVAALPLGGFYDRKLDALVQADGLEESSVYALLLGGRA